MNGINIDKWRVLNKTLFDAYINTYQLLQENSDLFAPEVLVNAFSKLGILDSLTKDGYGTAYTIAREIGIYYEDNGRYILSKISQSYVDRKLSYSDYLKYYCLNIEFLINNEVVHPYTEILDALNGQELNKNEIAHICTKLVPVDSPNSVIDCLRLFLNRCVEAELLIVENGRYKLAYSYNLLKGSCNLSNLSVDEFEQKFILGDQKNAQKNIVTNLIEREITHLFNKSFNLIANINNSIPKIQDKEDVNYSINLLDQFVDWFIKLNGDKHNYFSDSFSSNKDKLKNELIQYDEIYENEFNHKIFSTTKFSLKNLLITLKLNLDKKEGDFFEFSSKKSNHMPRAILGKNNYLKFLDELIILESKTKQNLNIIDFHKSTNEAGLSFSELIIKRFIASLSSKPFLILSGLSGSGKTKIAQSFVQWISENETQYKIVPVGADWTNREPLLGYPNGLEAGQYITPDTGVIHLLLEAEKVENKNKPYFLILDEMNLSHVERYFADFLSIIESNDTIKLYTGETRVSLDKITIPKEISWPKNLFIIGTVNIDETTYMFSPKVLDRANVIEFRIADDEIQTFLGKPGIPDLTKLTKQGIAMSESFLEIASNNNVIKNEIIANELVLFFKQLKPVGAEFGYRTATEIMQLISKLKTLDPSIMDNECLDIAIMQKLLPKLHGSRSKLVNVLIALGEICLVDAKDCKSIYFDSIKNDDLKNDSNVKYPISFEKLIRMYKNVFANGFTSYAEA